MFSCMSLETIRTLAIKPLPTLGGWGDSHRNLKTKFQDLNITISGTFNTILQRKVVEPLCWVQHLLAFGNKDTELIVASSSPFSYLIEPL